MVTLSKGELFEGIASNLKERIDSLIQTVLETIKFEQSVITESTMSVITSVRKCELTARMFPNHRAFFVSSCFEATYFFLENLV